MISSALVAGRYELIDDPLRGSMGEVYRAYDTHLDREVAVKVIHRDLLGGDLETELVRRFRREARLTAKAAHPGVPAVYDVGVDRDRHYVVMELIHGATLRDLLDELQPLPIAWVTFIAAQICAVLARTHELALIHRDLKPDNVMICADGTVKVIDFGVAILADAGPSSRLTPVGATAGDTRYQAPERLLGIATPQSDLFSLGRVIQDMLRDHVDAPAEHVMLSGELTRRQPELRPGNATEVFHRLEPLLGALPPLPGFVTRRQERSLRLYEQTLPFLSNAVTARKAPAAPSGPETGPRQHRVRAEKYADAGQFGRALRILESAIELADRQHDQAAVADLRRDLAAVLVRSGDSRQAVDACGKAVDAIAGRIAATHPAMAALRLAKARSHVAIGEIPEACATYQALIDDFAAAGLVLPEAVEARMESAALLAVQGEVARAVALVNLLIKESHPAVDPARANGLLAAMRELMHDAEVQASRSDGC
ncbi:hypothetical protein CS0771_32440 [Catellatospora sp. IY07-71]|uniref:protein kinase domain-containing protein n=1 Tax=Catellatospora sp. IY07-71 TaxID=2728827 RepID=UPI001BB39B02|nr:serine/threonine-protein kinase [Catellatospora sp. IY07-71]BCJ73700.1 hypothetical protein CS0771_32440 [Catellatospora sp. IY07-71]